MKTLERIQIHRALLSGVLAFLLLIGLSLLFSRSRAEPAAILESEKTVNTTQAAAGDVLTYTIVITSPVGESVTAWMTDTLPEELDYVSGSLVKLGEGSLGVMNDVITWTDGSFGFGEKVIITFSAQISPAIGATTIVNTAEIDGDGDLDTASASTDVTGPLAVLKTASSSSVQPEETLVYTVYITNVSASTIDPVSMTDDLPAEVSWAGGLGATSGTWGESNDVITWTGSLDPSGTVVITFTAEVSSTLSDGTVFTNTAEVVGPGGGLPATDSVQTTVNSTVFVHLPLIMYRYPPIPELYSIPEPIGSSNAYTVTWEEIDASSIEHYVLQESTSAGFSTYTEWELAGTSRAFEKGSAAGTYYYRVRVDGTTWGDGPWSNIESITLGFFDDFSDSGSGWPVVSQLVIPWSSTYYRTRYENGEYRIMVDQGGPDVWFHEPDALAPYVPPTDKYCVEVDVKFAKAQSPYELYDYYPYWANAGLIFGANDANTHLYAICLAVGAEHYSGGPADLGWFLVNNPTYQYPYKGCNYLPGSMGGEALGLNILEWHKFQISVDGDQIDVHVDGVHKGTEIMLGLSNMTRVGLVAGDYEVTPVDARFDNFAVIPNRSCEP